MSAAPVYMRRQVGRIYGWMRTTQLYLFSNPSVGIQTQNLKSALPWFFGLIAADIIITLIYQRDWILGGQMFAEMTNYFEIGRSKNLLHKLFTRDFCYIPLIPRIIAALANYLRIGADNAPFVYSWSAVLCGSAMAATFCLAPFRQLIPSDFLRFSIGLLILINAGFDTTVFMSFTYFGIFLLAAFSALSLVPNAPDAPKWGWLTPLLVLSKPYIVAIIPGLLLGLILAKPRFRKILFVQLALVIWQLQQIRHSYHHLPPVVTGTPIPFFDALGGGIKYYFGWLGGYFDGPFYIKYSFKDVSACIISGVIITLLGIGMTIWIRRAAGLMILQGILTLLATTVFNAYAMSSQWPSDADLFTTLWVTTHNITGYFGALMVFAGIMQLLSDRLSVTSAGLRPAFYKTAPVLFVVWVLTTGWLINGLKHTVLAAYPLQGSDNWRKFSILIDSPNTPYCIPVAPYPGTTFRNCTLASTAPDWDAPTILLHANEAIDIPPPDSVKGAPIMALAVVMHPISVSDYPVKITMQLEAADGKTSLYIGDNTLVQNGTIILLTGTPITDVVKATLVSDSPGLITTLTEKGNPAPALLWYKPIP
jgi:hypothetical protein